MGYYLFQKKNQVNPLRINLDRDEVIVGRKDFAYVYLSVHVSRKHASFQVAANNEWFLKDLGGQNGTYLNGEKIGRGLQKLHVGDIIGFGVPFAKSRCEFEFEFCKDTCHVEGVCENDSTGSSQQLSSTPASSSSLTSCQAENGAESCVASFNSHSARVKVSTKMAPNYASGHKTEMRPDHKVISSDSFSRSDTKRSDEINDVHKRIVNQPLPKTVVVRPSNDGDGTSFNACTNSGPSCNKPSLPSSSVIPVNKDSIKIECIDLSSDDDFENVSNVKVQENNPLTTQPTKSHDEKRDQIMNLKQLKVVLERLDPKTLKRYGCLDSQDDSDSSEDFEVTKHPVVRSKKTLPVLSSSSSSSLSDFLYSDDSDEKAPSSSKKRPSEFTDERESKTKYMKKSNVFTTPEESDDDDTSSGMVVTNKKIVQLNSSSTKSPSCTNSYFNKGSGEKSCDPTIAHHVKQKVDRSRAYDVSEFGILGHEDKARSTGKTVEIPFIGVVRKTDSVFDVASSLPCIQREQQDENEDALYPSHLENEDNGLSLVPALNGDKAKEGAISMDQVLNSSSFSSVHIKQENIDYSITNPTNTYQNANNASHRESIPANSCESLKKSDGKNSQCSVLFPVIANIKQEVTTEDVTPNEEDIGCNATNFSSNLTEVSSVTNTERNSARDPHEATARTQVVGDAHSKSIKREEVPINHAGNLFVGNDDDELGYSQNCEVIVISDDDDYLNFPSSQGGCNEEELELCIKSEPPDIEEDVDAIFGVDDDSSAKELYHEKSLSLPSAQDVDCDDESSSDWDNFSVRSESITNIKKFISISSHRNISDSFVSNDVPCSSNSAMSNSDEHHGRVKSTVVQNCNSVSFHFVADEQIQPEESNNKVVSKSSSNQLASTNSSNEEKDYFPELSQAFFDSCDMSGDDSDKHDNLNDEENHCDNVNPQLQRKGLYSNSYRNLSDSSFHSNKKKSKYSMTRLTEPKPMPPRPRCLRGREEQFFDRYEGESSSNVSSPLVKSHIEKVKQRAISETARPGNSAKRQKKSSKNIKKAVQKQMGFRIPTPRGGSAIPMREQKETSVPKRRASVPKASVRKVKPAATVDGQENFSAVPVEKKNPCVKKKPERFGSRMGFLTDPPPKTNLCSRENKSPKKSALSPKKNRNNLVFDSTFKIPKVPQAKSLKSNSPGVVASKKGETAIKNSVNIGGRNSENSQMSRNKSDKKKCSSNMNSTFSKVSGRGENQRRSWPDIGRKSKANPPLSFKPSVSRPHDHHKNPPVHVKDINPGMNKHSRAMKQHIANGESSSVANSCVKIPSSSSVSGQSGKSPEDRQLSTPETHVPNIPQHRQNWRYMIGESSFISQSSLHTNSSPSCSHDSNDYQSPVVQESTSVANMPSNAPQSGQPGISRVMDPRLRGNAHHTVWRPQPLAQEGKEIFQQKYVTVSAHGERIDFDYMLGEVLNVWIPSWLNEYEVIGKPPRQVSWNVFPLPMSFNSCDHYSSCFYPMIRLELWDQVYEEWSSSKHRNAIGVMINECYAENNLMILQCQSLVNRYSPFVPREGTLLIVDLRVKKEVIPVFGYVFKHKIDPYDPQTCKLHREWYKRPEASSPESMLYSYAVKTNKKSISPQLDKLMKACVVSRISNKLKVADVFQYLLSSVLQRYILQPSEEVFRVSTCEKSIPSSVLGKYNQQQIQIIANMTREMRTPFMMPKMLLLQGPPGTGKTHTILGIIQNLLSNKHDNVKILVATASNAAVDEIGRRLIALNKDWKSSGMANNVIRVVRIGLEKQIHQDLLPYLLEEMAVRNVKADFLKELKSLESKLLEKNKTIEKIKNQLAMMGSGSAPIDDMKRKQSELQVEIRRAQQLEREISCIKQKRNSHSFSDQSKIENYKVQLLRKAHVILSTLSSCRQRILNNVFNFKSDINFTCCIVDEATQCTEPEVLQPLVFGICKFILVGDHKQLPATVRSKLAEENNFGRSLFERIHEYFCRNKLNSPVVMLTEQYRMHSEICRFPSSNFYSNKLTTFPGLDMNYISFPFKPFVVLDILYGQETTLKSSKTNLPEAKAVIEICKNLYKVISKKKSVEVGIVTPYQGQRYIYLNEFARHPDLKEIEINTVDGFQGQEKDVIIVSCVRARSDTGSIGFLACKKRLNVAITRARQCLIIIGHMSSLMRDPDWGALIDSAKRRKLFISVTSVEDIPHIMKEIRVPTSRAVDR